MSIRLLLLTPALALLVSCQSSAPEAPSVESPAPAAQFAQRPLMRGGQPMRFNRENREARNPISRLDRDGDGQISQAEFLRPVEQRQDNLFLLLDRDGDNLITKADLPELRMPREERFPQRAEAINMMTQCLGEAGVMPESNDDGLRELLGKVREDDLQLDLGAFVTPGEDRALGTFGEIDSNGDGQLDEGELRAAGEQRRQQQMARRTAMRSCMSQLREERMNRQVPSV